MAEELKPDAEVNDGGVTIADTVVAKVAHNACREIDGVHGLGGATSRALSSLRGGESKTQGVSVDVHEDTIDIDLTVVVTHGVNIPQVAETCRAKVKEQVESITGMSVRAVNVVVSDIYFPEDTPGSADDKA